MGVVSRSSICKTPQPAPKCAIGTPRPARRVAMAKGQVKKSKEARKPKAEKPKKQNASNPSTKGVVPQEKK